MSMTSTFICTTFLCIFSIFNGFYRLCTARLKLKACKCVIRLPELVYLSHVISLAGIQSNLEKLRAVLEFPRPLNLKCMQSFIGLINHHSRFVYSFATLAAPLYRLMKKWVAFMLGNNKEATFDHLKTPLSMALLLIYLHFNRPFLLHIEGLQDAIGASVKPSTAKNV